MISRFKTAANIKKTLTALKEGNVKHIIAKCKDSTHKKVLEKLEIDEIILPEEDMAKTLAKNLLEKREHI